MQKEQAIQAALALVNDAAGATREEMISAILVGLPAAGHAVTPVLPAAIAAYDV